MAYLIAGLVCAAPVVAEPVTTIGPAAVGDRDVGRTLVYGGVARLPAATRGPVAEVAPPRDRAVGRAVDAARQTHAAGPLPNADATSFRKETHQYQA